MRRSAARSASATRWKSYAFMLVNTVIWGAAFIVVKPSLEITTPFRYLLYRYLIAGVIALPILWYYARRIKVTLKMLATISGIEVIGTGLALSFVYWGLNYTSAIEAGLLTSSLPIFVTLGGIWLLKEREEHHEWLGLGLAVAGTLILTLIPLLLGEHNGALRVSLLGNLLILAHNAANLFYYPLAKKHYTGIPKLFTTSVSLYVGLVFFGLISWWEAGSLPNLITLAHTDLLFPSVWVASGYMAIFGSLIALTAYMKGQDGIEASEAALFGYLQPLIYLPLGVMLLGETLTIWHILGLVLTTGGVYLAERRVRRSR